MNEFRDRARRALWALARFCRLASFGRRVETLSVACGNRNNARLSYACMSVCVYTYMHIYTNAHACSSVEPRLGLQAMPKLRFHAAPLPQPHVGGGPGVGRQRRGAAKYVRSCGRAPRPFVPSTSLRRDAPSEVAHFGRRAKRMSPRVLAPRVGAEALEGSLQRVRPPAACISVDLRSWAIRGRAWSFGRQRWQRKP